jgi:hypothetical protein
MKIKLLKRSCCDELLSFKNNSSIKEKYNLKKYPDKDLGYIDIPSSIEISEDLELSPSPQDDLESSIKIFEAFKKLDRVQANDRRLWVALTHDKFFTYTQERWQITSESSDQVILRRFHFEGSSLEARMRNSISRLWWAAKITYDENREDPYELTRVLWSKQQLQQSVVERSYGTYSTVVRGILETYLNNNHLSDFHIKLLAKGLNAIGGVKLLANFTTQEVKENLETVAKFNNISLK